MYWVMSGSREERENPCEAAGYAGIRFRRGTMSENFESKKKDLAGVLVHVSLNFTNYQRNRVDRTTGADVDA